MKLTPEQIAQIDEALVLKDLVYEDIKLELTDHIASDIETIMTGKEIPFEVAFKEAFEKWNPQLISKTNSLWAPYWKMGPKLLMDKWIKQSKEQFLYAVLSAITVALIVWNTEIYNDTIYNTVVHVFNYLSLSVIVLLIVGRLLMLKAKINTSYGNMFNNKLIKSIPILYLGIDKTHLFYHCSVSIGGSLFSPPTATFFIVYAVLSFPLLYKHFQFEKKLSKV